jgi:hypothetical protein
VVAGGPWKRLREAAAGEKPQPHERERPRQSQANGYAVATTKPYNKTRAPMRSSCSNIATSAKVTL